MKKLKGFQKKYLKGLAHELKPVVHIGQNAVTDALIKSMNQALERHELIKVKFINIKEKEQKQEISNQLEKQTKSQVVGTIGHIVIFFREQKDEEKRKITIKEVNGWQLTAKIKNRFYLPIKSLESVLMF